MTGAPFFSIVVPTRSRGATLRHTLETCARIGFIDAEFIIGDNASTDDTPAIAAEFVARDRRFRHCRSAEPLPAAANFERLLDEARGEYLIYIGDDDGIYRHALPILADLIERYRPDALNWLPDGFIWPGSRRAVTAIYPLDQLTELYSETAEAARSRVNGLGIVHHFSLTGFDVYHGCVSRAAVDRARARFGRLFGGPIPDVAASYLLMEVIDQVLLPGVAATVAATSGFSIGDAYTTPSPTEAQIAIRESFRQEIVRNFPNTDPIIGAHAMLPPYLASFADHLRRCDGSLKRLNALDWADVLLDQIALDHAGDCETLLAQANDFFARARLDGAPRVAPITKVEVEARRERATHRRRMPLTPYSFTKLEMEDARLGYPPRMRRRAGAIAYNWATTETAMFLDARTGAEEFGVADFATLREHMLQLGDGDWINAFLDDPTQARDTLYAAQARDAAEDLLPTLAAS